MDMIISIIFGLGITTFVIVLLQHLGRISKHLRIVRLQLEIQNPMFTSNELLELDKNILYWQEKMFKHKDSYGEQDKDIRDVTFNLFWAYVERLNHFRVMIAEAKETGNPTKVHAKYEDWLHKNEEEIEKMEKKAKTLDAKIKADIERRSLDLEFLGKWDKEEN
jgi:tRNA U34 5-carboxymethylaminomethyl modifying enzyme MnmG/GidA